VISLDKKEDLINYCGLYCGDCHGYNGRIPDLARDLRKELRACHYEKFANFIADEGFGKTFKGYDKCYEVLGAMVKFRCKKGCRNGGGPPFCKIRNCCTKKSYDGCWECTEFEKCEKLDFLKPVHGDAHIKNLQTIKKKGKEQFLTGQTLWYHPVKNK